MANRCAIWPRRSSGKRERATVHASSPRSRAMMPIRIPMLSVWGGGSASYAGRPERRARYNLFEIEAGRITWVTRAHDLANVRDFLIAFPEHPGAIGRCVVHCDLAFTSLFQIDGQALIGSEHVGKVSVAATGRNFQGVQDRGLGRHFDVCHVGMPNRLAVAQISDRLAAFHHIGDDVELGVFLVERLAVRVWSRRVEFAEVLAEGDELRVGELLATEDHNQPFAVSLWLTIPIGEIRAIFPHAATKTD